MDTKTGNLYTTEQMERMMDDRRVSSTEPEMHFVPVLRDLSKKEESEMKIRKYSKCGCGSGRKFKFCCFRK